MKTITPNQLIPEGLMQDNSTKLNNHTPESISSIEAGKTEFENQPEKQNAPDKGAKLMQRIWGDNFLSDSLH